MYSLSHSSLVSVAHFTEVWFLNVCKLQPELVDNCATITTAAVTWIIDGWLRASYSEFGTSFQHLHQKYYRAVKYKNATTHSPSTCRWRSIHIAKLVIQVLEAAIRFVLHTDGNDFNGQSLLTGFFIDCMQKQTPVNHQTFMFLS